MFHPKTLQQRTILFVLVPVFLFLTIAGAFGYQAVRKLLLEQWGETALANLERAAHSVDMQLNRPKQVLLLLEGLPPGDSETSIRKFIVDRLRKVEGVVSVKVDWPTGENNKKFQFMRHNMMMGGTTWQAGTPKLEISAPTYNVEHEGKTFSLVSSFVDKSGNNVGRVEVVMDFDSLIRKVVQAPWWNVYEAYVVDYTGNVLAATKNKETETDGQDAKLFGSRGLLERKTHTALMVKTAGTVFGPGRPPEKISGFYRLKQAPWTLVLVAPGKEVLQPIISFRNVYFLTATACIVLILIFIRMMIGKTTRSIKKISETANELAGGVFNEPLAVTTRDEVGELTRNFNTMTSQLQKGMKLQEAMDIAREVQLTLLPQQDVKMAGLEISGVSIYCDETGGDYFDFISSSSSPKKLQVMLGDVVGHGIGAALLMATLRALVRARVDLPGTPAEVVADVNRQLCLDTAKSSNFASLFYLDIDMEEKELQWIRAGHDPAIMYHPESGKFTELKGKGMVLGLNDAYEFTNSTVDITGEKVIILISSDGSWEVENEHREQFGKERLKELLAENCQLLPSQMLARITEAIDGFRGNVDLHDDITLIALALDGTEVEAARDDILG